jgi:CO/xanthine dehydrogenase FAD-binding subunit
MNRFELVRAQSTQQARELVAEKAGSVLKAGGIDLLDHLKEHLVEPPPSTSRRFRNGPIADGRHA